MAHDPLEHLQVDYADGCPACLADQPHCHDGEMQDCAHAWVEDPPCCVVELHVEVAAAALVMEAARLLRERR